MRMKYEKNYSWNEIHCTTIVDHISISIVFVVW